MKTIQFILMLACGFLMIGCAAVTTTEPIRVVTITPEVSPMPLTADLRITQEHKSSSQVKVENVKNVKNVNLDLLTNLAIARALDQEPPRIDGPDVLIGMDVFTQHTRNEIIVTVTGYPAYYTNFRSADSDNFVIHTAQRIQSEQTPGGRYVAIRWMPTMYAGAFTEFGWIFGNNYHFGFDGGVGVSSDRFTGGFSLNVGHSTELSNDFTVAYGGSLGVWFWEEEQSGGYWDYDYDERFGYFGPYVKLRWSGVELAYRLLIGDGVINQFTVGYYHEFSRRNRK